MRAKITNYLDQLSQAPTTTLLGLTLVISIWVLTAVLVAGLMTLASEQSTQASLSPQGTQIPVLVVEPTSGPVGTFVTLWGENWIAGETVFIYLMTPDETQIPDYAVANTVADEAGRFVTGFTLPSGPHWENQSRLIIIARTDANGPLAQADFTLEQQTVPPTDLPAPQIDVTSTATTQPESEAAEPTTTPTQAASIASDQLPPTSSTTQTTTSNPTATTATTVSDPTATSTANLNIRRGPGLDYPVLGLLPLGHSATITGLSSDGRWWQIQFAGAADGVGWVSAFYVTTQNSSNVPVVQAPPPPSPTPVGDDPAWQAEYFPQPRIGRLAGDHAPGCRH